MIRAELPKTFPSPVAREPVVKQRVANSESGGKACRDWCEAKTAPWPVHKVWWSRDSAAL